MGDYIAVYIPSPSGQPSGGIFGTLSEAAKCASTPEAKARGGARFKRFNNAEDAKAFVEHGDDGRSECSMSFFSPERPSSSSPHGANISSSESIITYPPVSAIVLNRLRRAIETKDNDAFVGFVKENPRCLVNIGGDKPTIVFEGCRYNALHVAAKCGNCYVIRYILKFICDYDSLLDVYGTSISDVRNRSKALVDSYLNTPDKGAGDTPLHFASKFGHKEAVEIFLTYEELEKDRLNNDNKSPLDVCACRYTRSDKAEVREAIQRLLRSFYVPLYRPMDNSTSAVILAPGAYPSKTISRECNGQSSFVNYVIAAVAGPFDCMESASSFHKEWITRERDKRLRDPMKGAEEVGRCLAKTKNIKWMEKWPFSQQLIDLNSREGLVVLNNFLLELQRKQQHETLELNNSDYVKHLRTVRRRLFFDDVSDTGIDEDGEVFFDAVDHFDCTNNTEGNCNLNYNTNNLSTSGDEQDKDDTINSLTNHMNLLRLDDSVESCEVKANGEECGSERNEICELDDCFDGSVKGTLKRGFPEPLTDFEEYTKFSGEMFYTPPSSPKAVYISDEIATKDDENLLTALKLVDPDLINKFCAIEEYVRKLEKIPAASRARLPYTDSPRRAKFKRSHLKY